MATSRIAVLRASNMLSMAGIRVACKTPVQAICLGQQRRLQTGYHNLRLKQTHKLNTDQAVSIHRQADRSSGNGKSQSKYRYGTAAVAGAVLIAGIFTKLQSATGDKEEESTDSSSEDDKHLSTDSVTLTEAIKQSRDLLQRKKDESGSPGLVVAVSVNGRLVWKEGMGYAEVENRLPCTPDTIFRIASISKSITMAAVAKLWENGDLDIDKPVQFYVKEFPDKYWNGQKVAVTTRQLVCHMSGIRNYNKAYMKTKTGGEASSAASNKGQNSDDDKIDLDVLAHKEFLMKEYYISKNYSSVLESLDVFKDDPLVCKPGTEFLYSTHGWTLVSAVVEKAAKMPFEKYLKKMLDEMGLENTYLEEYQPLIYNRGRHYVKDKQGKLTNAPYVDLSYKWAGGGLVSNVLDLIKFGNVMLYSYQARGHHSKSPVSTQGRQQKSLSGKEKEKEISSPRGYLKPETVEEMWSLVSTEKSGWDGIPNGGYGLGWSVWKAKNDHPFCKDQKFIVSHTGAAIGASSVLFILPLDDVTGNKKNEMKPVDTATSLPQGVVVAIIVNMMSVSLNKTAYDIAKIFQNVNENELNM